MRRDDFGGGFTWGVASAAWQIEGAAHEGGKAPSVWDEAGRRGRVAGGPSVGDTGIDFFHRYRDDLALVAELGFGAKRFSLSWPRLYGDGRGPLSAAGADFYDRVIDSCLELDLEPWVTVHHWDLPLALEREGGWRRRGIVEDFAAFAQACGERFGDRVRWWMVFNEPSSVAMHELVGVHRSWGLHVRDALRAVHHMNLAGAEAGRRLRSVLPGEARIGTTHVTTVAHPYETDDPGVARTKRAVEAILCDMFIDPAGGRGYPFEAARVLKLMEPAIHDGDLEAATFRHDFLGIQYYGPVPLRRVPLPGAGAVPVAWVRGAEAKVRSEVGFPVHPEGLLAVLRKYHGHPAADRLVVTENGIGLEDRLDGERIRDDVRTWYVREHLRAVLAARQEGIPVDGYFHWSYADNVEWLMGTRPRFGLVHVDYEHGLTRRPKDSARWFQRFLAGEEA